VTQLILVLLAVVWVAVLVPPYLRGRREGRPGDSITSFRQQLTVLERATPGSRPVSSTGSVLTRTAPVRVPPRSFVAPATIASRRRARERRRQVLQVLVGMALLTAVLALAGGPVFLYLHVFVDLILVGYLGLLVQMQRIAAVQYSALRYHRSAA
jgi:hypothetical protein